MGDLSELHTSRSSMIHSVASRKLILRYVYYLELYKCAMCSYIILYRHVESGGHRGHDPSVFQGGGGGGGGGGAPGP